MAGFFEPRGQGVEARRRPARLLLRDTAGGLGSCGPDLRARNPPCAGPGRLRHPTVLQRPRGLHPRRCVLPREAPEVDGCFVAAGFNSVGLQSAGGVGWVLADWIADGHPPMDLSAVDIRRAFPFQGKPEYLKERIPRASASSTPCTGHSASTRAPATSDCLQSTIVSMPPAQSSARSPGGSGRTGSPSTGRSEPTSTATASRTGSRRPVSNVTPCGTRWASSTRLLRQVPRQGPDALGCTQRDLRERRGCSVASKAVYTQWCNDRGGIEADLTVTRIDEDEYFVVTAAAAGTG